VLFALLHVVKLSPNHICLTVGAQADIQWWESLLGHWRGS